MKKQNVGRNEHREERRMKKERDDWIMRTINRNNYKFVASEDTFFTFTTTKC